MKVRLVCVLVRGGEVVPEEEDDEEGGDALLVDVRTEVVDVELALEMLVLLNDVKVELKEVVEVLDNVDVIVEEFVEIDVDVDVDVEVEDEEDEEVEEEEEEIGDVVDVEDDVEELVDNDVQLVM